MSAVFTLPLPVSLPNEGRWRCPSLIAAGLSRAGAAVRFDPQCSLSLSELVNRPVDAVVVLDSQLLEDFTKSAHELLQLMSDSGSTVVILVARRDAPEYQFRPDGPVFSFMCSPMVLKQVLMEHPATESRDLCFELLHGILNGSIADVDRLLVRQIPPEHSAGNGLGSKLPVALVMAHRGEQRYLDTALRYLARAEGTCRIRVGLDVESAEDYRSLMQCHARVEFFHAVPAPLGPYVIRQELANKSPEPLLTLQDSDDLSCHNRFTMLAGEIAHSGCDMVGSHELRVDEIERHVVAVRFPLDATAALKERNVFALLHASLMIKRESFFLTGGLSTDQIVANDTQFLMRAFFHCRIRNVDEFLYIRRKHPRALTIAPETAAGNDLRSRLDRQWTQDFEAVKRGEIALAESSLRPMRAAAAYKLEPVYRNFFAGRA